MEVEAYENLVRARVARFGNWRGAIREHLEGHGGGVVGHAVEIWGGELQVGQAEEGGEDAVGAELDAEGLAAGCGDGRVEELYDLARERHAGDGDDGVAGVVGEVPFVRISERAELEEDVGGNEVGGVDCCVVDFGDVD